MRFYLLFLLGLISSFTFAQTENTLVYKEKSSILFYGSKPLPTWLEVIVNMDNTDEQYHFLPKFKTPFEVWGWKKIDLVNDIKKNWKSSNTILEDQIKQGWVYSSQEIKGIPNGWLYSPIFSLFFNSTGITHLDRFFQKYLGTIPFLRNPSLNQAKENQFIRLIIPPDNNIAYIELKPPEDIVLAYKTIIANDSGEFVYVFYITNAKKNLEIQLIKGIIHYKDATSKPFLYRIKIYPKESKAPDKEQ